MGLTPISKKVCIVHHHEHNLCGANTPLHRPIRETIERLVKESVLEVVPGSLVHSYVLNSQGERSGDVENFTLLDLSDVTKYLEYSCFSYNPDKDVFFEFSERLSVMVPSYRADIQEMKRYAKSFREPLFPGFPVPYTE